MSSTLYRVDDDTAILVGPGGPEEEPYKSRAVKLPSGYDIGIFGAGSTKDGAYQTAYNAVIRWRQEWRSAGGRPAGTAQDVLTPITHHMWEWSYTALPKYDDEVVPVEGVVSGSIWEADRDKVLAAVRRTLADEPLMPEWRSGIIRLRRSPYNVYGQGTVSFEEETFPITLPDPAVA